MGLKSSKSNKLEARLQESGVGEPGSFKLVPRRKDCGPSRGCPASKSGGTPAASPSSPPGGSLSIGAWEPREVLVKATFAAGCFWGVEATFRAIEGVLGTEVGYTGGQTQNPTYKDVCTDETGHAEAVQIEFDPARVPYEKLLEVFWENHDPTTLNRQGPDVGTQYRSAIFFHSPEQESLAKASKAQLETTGRFKRPIVTQILPAPTFYKAEEYHQQYLEKRGLAHCHIR